MPHLRTICSAPHSHIRRTFLCHIEKAAPCESVVCGGTFYLQKIQLYIHDRMQIQHRQRPSEIEYQVDH